MTPEEFDREVGDLARSLSGDGGLSRHERLRRQRNVRRWVDRHTGMCKTLLSLDPLDDAKVWTAFNAAVASARTAKQDDDERTWDQLQTDAIVDHITRQRAPGRRGRAARSMAEVSVLIDYTALLHGGDARVAETADGQPLPVEVIRRLGCDGTIVPIWLGGDHEVLAVGRQCRLATRAQRRALRAMYRTCGFPDCTVGFEHCRIHHVTYWEHFGRTDLDNLVPSVNTTTTSSTKAAGRCSCTPGDGSPCCAPTAPSPSTASPPTASPHRPSTPPRRTLPPTTRPSSRLSTKRPPPTTVDEIAEDLQLALEDVRQLTMICVSRRARPKADTLTPLALPTPPTPPPLPPLAGPHPAPPPLPPSTMNPALATWRPAPP